MSTLSHRFSVADFYRMAEAGILREDERVELLNGEVCHMMPIGPFHASLVSKLNWLFSRDADSRWLTWSQNPVQLSDYSEVQPDISLVKPRRDFYQKAPPSAGDCLLVIEVADSSINRDRESKLPLYAQSGIEEVWLINVPQRQVEVYTEPSFLNYTTATIFKNGQSVSPAAFPDITIDVGVLFD